MCTPQCIIEKLGGLAFDEAVKSAKKRGNYVRHYKTYLKNLHDEMKNLKHQIDVIGERVRVATDRGDQVVYPSVLLWQTESDKIVADAQKLLGQSSGADAEKIPPVVLETVEQSSGTDVDNITSGIQELEGQSSGTDANKITRDDDQELVGQSSGTVNMTCFACTCPNIKQRYRLGKQAEQTIADVQKLISQSLTFIETSRPKPPPQEDEFMSMENYVTMDSRTPIFEGIVDALKQSGVNIVGVHGLGGVGKTTLVKEIAKKMRADGTFKHVLLVTVSKDFNVMELQKKLAGELNLKLDAPADEKSGRNQLWRKFETGEKFLVILDDIWDKVDLNAIGIRCADGCKVVLTSRKEDLLGRTMRADKNFAIAKLTDPEAWTLFKKEVGDSIESRQQIAYDVMVYQLQ